MRKSRNHLNDLFFIEMFDTLLQLSSHALQEIRDGEFALRYRNSATDASEMVIFH